MNVVTDRASNCQNGDSWSATGTHPWSDSWHASAGPRPFRDDDAEVTSLGVTPRSLHVLATASTPSVGPSKSKRKVAPGGPQLKIVTTLALMGSGNMYTTSSLPSLLNGTPRAPLISVGDTHWSSTTALSRARNDTQMSGAGEPRTTTPTMRSEWRPSESRTQRSLSPSSVAQGTPLYRASVGPLTPCTLENLNIGGLNKCTLSVPMPRGTTAATQARRALVSPG